jgi:hypothetical protein
VGVGTAAVAWYRWIHYRWIHVMSVVW